ncbi:MAG: HAMP domain-containing histidine kinase [Chloroflexi bacterium]|nr:MAG: HAMP domain-containing histidine kinase [Chloroflexota bacterium]
MTLRLRLTLLYVGLLAAALAVTGITGYVIAAHRIYAGLDDSLTLRAQAVALALEPIGTEFNQEDIENNKGELDALASKADLVFQLRRADGTVLYSSAQPPSGSLPPPDDTRSLVGGFATKDVRGEDTRILYQPLPTGGSIEVGESLSGANGAVSEIRDVIVVGGLAALLVTAVSGYTLSGRALRPVRNVSQMARDIEETADFTRRLDKSAGEGEVRELVSAFNAMIERVEQTLAHQKSFLADSSHELRRPLSVLQTNVDILSRPNLSQADRERCVAEVRVEAQIMRRLVADLLMLAREESQSIERARVDFSAVCERALARVKQEDSHELREEIEPGIVVLGDGERLDQMVGNLLDNAVQYTPREGRVVFGLQRFNGRVQLEVRDTGQGIKADEIAHVFERFYRGESARASRPAGTGLGLAIVKYVAEAHGGTVSVVSEPTNGTTFVVELPIPGDGETRRA